MKNFVKKAFLSVFACCLFFSCSDSDLDDNNRTSEEAVVENISSKKAYISISLGDSLSAERTVEPNALDKNDLMYELWGKQASDSVLRKLATWVSYDKLKEKRVIDITEGAWTFTLKAFMDSNTQILTDTIEKSISYGVNTLSFDMKEVPGTGDIDVTFWFPKLENGCVKAEMNGLGNNDIENTIYSKTKIEISEEEKIIDGNTYSSVVYKKTGVASGYYLLKFYIYENETDANPKSYYSTLVKVSHGSVSSGTERLGEGNYVTIFRTASGIAWNSASYAQKYKIYKYETEDYVNPQEFNTSLFPSEFEETENVEYELKNTSVRKNLYVAVKAWSEKRESEFSNVICLIPSSYSIKYELGEGVEGVENPNPETYSVVDGLILQDISREGFVFCGWYESKDFSTEKVTAIAKGSTGSRTLYAKWEGISYTIIFNANDSNANGNMASLKAEYGKSIELTQNNFSRDGKTFFGWAIDKDSEVADYTDKQCVINLCSENGGTVILYAVWINGTNGTIVSSSEISSTIMSLTESTTLIVAGSLTDSVISSINTALKKLKKSYPDVLVGLDLSKTSGLSYLSSASATDSGESFYGCSNLAQLLLPGRVTSIGSYAFYGCTGLTSVEIPSSVTSIGEYAFGECSGLTSVEIGNSVTSIGSSAFYRCSGLKKMDYKGSLEQWLQIQFASSSANPCGYGADLYLNGEKLTDAKIPDGVTSIGEYAFYCCSGLTSVEIPDSVTSIGESAFYGCSGLTSVEIPDSVTSIGASAFYGCSGLTSVEIPSSVRSIGASAFGYSGLTSVEIPSSVTSIESFAFCGCSGLKSVKIPNSVTSIGESAFFRCSGLTSVEIPSSVTSIGGSAFKECSGLKSVEIPSSVTSISRYAFEGCRRLTSVEIGNSVTSIGDYAFYKCSGLTSVEIPSSVTSIGESAFSGCSWLTSVEIPSSVTSIGKYAFFDCSGLTSVEIPGSVTSIGESAFDRCTGLTSVEIPSSVTSIGDNAFYGCSGLTSVEIGNSVTSIGKSAFSYTGLTSVEIPSSVTSIGKSAFYECDWLTSVEIGNSVTSIGSYAFGGCSGLTSVEIGNSVTSIGSYAFDRCSGLQTINFTGSIAMWKSISKGESWGSYVPAAVVHCNDGDVSLYVSL